jgi:HK97 family phage major capsid protein
MNENTNTLTANRSEMKSLIDEAITKRIKSLPDRTALKSLDAASPKNEEREKIRKTFRFFSALAQNNYAELQSIQSSYSPEYIKVLSPQIEGTGSAGGYLVPEEFFADVIYMLNEFGFARKFCAGIGMKTNVLNVSTLA